MALKMSFTSKHVAWSKSGSARIRYISESSLEQAFAVALDNIIALRQNTTLLNHGAPENPCDKQIEHLISKIIETRSGEGIPYSRG